MLLAATKRAPSGSEILMRKYLKSIEHKLVPVNVYITCSLSRRISKSSW